MLANVIGKFTNNSIKNYGLSLSHYLSSPALSWDAMLNMTKVKLELISGLDMYIFFEKGMKGGVSYNSNIYSKANNKYLKSYDPSLDENDLYGYAMSKFLRTSESKWTDSKEFDLNKYTSNSSKGCVLEVNPEYPKELRE